MVEHATAVLVRFNDAFNRHDVPAMMALMQADCAFENTFPAPDGTRYEGQAAVEAFWIELFRASPTARIEVEELFVAGDRAVQRWVYRWADNEESGAGYVRGVDLFRLADGLIAEKCSYVKG